MLQGAPLEHFASRRSPSSITMLRYKIKNEPATSKNQMMSIKKPLLIQNFNPRIIFILIVWLIIGWILAKPLQGIGKSIYLLFGSFTNNAFQSIYQTKLSAEEIIKAKSLTSEQAKLISQLKIKINCLEKENKSYKNLETLLDLKKHISHKTTTANVIGRSPDNWHKQIIIHRGENYFVMPGDSVISSKGIVGQIIDTDKTTSLVQLISDPAYRVGCKIKRKNILGILSGKTNSIAQIEFVPFGSDVKIGDVVITSGIGTGKFPPTYPSNHPIGKISKISKKKSRASDLYIEVKLFEDLSTLSEVLVFSPQ